MLMVLHHETNPELTLRETHRVLRAGACLMIRDTDADTAELKLFNHVMEDFYYQVFRDLPGVPNPACHESAAYWERMFQTTGFIIIKTERPEPGNPFTPVHWQLLRPG
jgi:ubiquinone/menaquinone biosynthesis C-methylase UbiE